jgi:hypothetical protein
VRPVDRLVDDPLDQDRDRERERGEDERAGEAEPDQPPLLPPEREEAAQGRPEGEIGRIDVVHGLETTVSAGCKPTSSATSLRLDMTSS